MNRFRFLSAASLVVTLVHAAAAFAEPSSQEKALASRLFDDATKLMAGEQNAQACAKYAESQRLDPQLGTLLHLGECYAKIGKTASAWTSFKEASELATQRNDPRARKIRERLASVEQDLSNLVIVVRDNEPSGLEIRQDGAVVGKAGWGTPIPVDPGEHVISATAPGVKPREVRAAVGPKGQTATVNLPPFEALPPDAAPPPGNGLATPAANPQLAPTPEEGRSWFSTHRRLTALVVGGVGVVGIGVGTAFGLSAKSTYDKSAAHCNGDHCDSAGHDYRRSALDKASVSNVAFGVGAAALIGGAVLWLTAPKDAAPEAPKSTFTPIVGRDLALVSWQRSF